MLEPGRLSFGVATGQTAPYPVLEDRWRYLEELGFDSIWHFDHFLQPFEPSLPYYEGWTLLAALAARTNGVRVGLLVASNTFRHPALLAQQAITLDHVSGGRLELGIGAGWFVEEHDRFGVRLHEPAVRVDRFEEALEIIDPLLRGETVSYQGSHYQLNGARLRPRPVQSPRPPLTLGAHRPRMLGICARYADRWNSTGTVEQMAQRNRRLDEACRKIGRDPAQIIRSVLAGSTNLDSQGLPDAWSSVDAFAEVVGRYAEVGVGELIFEPPQPQQYATAERIMSEVR
ncbi:MAG: LLM class flavin-dependent oxidoreductase [Actinomycetia bacterium]|nr:LLM class flavin-dependent oxidoreductase [Actinomycetes bacterium]